MKLLHSVRTRLANREDSEHEQAVLRIVIVGLFLGYMAGFNGWPRDWTAPDFEIVLVLVAFFLIAITIFAAICISPSRNVPRRLIGMLADSGGVTWYMFMAGEYGFFAIGVYLFITFGNGFRYGRQYLFGCQALCLLGFSGVLAFAPYWAERRIPGFGICLALVVLPLYVSTLLKRIQEARARAEEANTAKTTFLANMSHEMRTPLNGMVGVVDLFKTTDLSLQQKELVQLLRHSVSVLRSLIDDVLDISKIEAGRLSIDITSFDLHATINGLVQLLRPYAQSKGLALHATVDPELEYRLRGDSHHLRQILLNLLGNAIKFTERGEVTLAVKLCKKSIDGVTARFEVIDTGIGIPPEAIARIFERFVQADQSTTRRFGGSGLGTTIAKQLVELMGGTIGARSQLGEGSTFWFELPLLRDATAEQEERLEPASAKSNDRAILVADSTRSQRARKLLSAAGEQVELLSPADSFGNKLDTLLASGISIRAVVAACDVDSACSAFASARQRLGDRPFGLVYLAAQPLSVVDGARITSFREATVLDSNAAPRLLANAIRAATAIGGRDDGEAIDLGQLLKRERMPLKVLVAEDNPTNQAIISRLLSGAGHAILLASDGERALDLYERERPDLAILDFNMPNRTGVEVIQAIRAMEAPGVRMPAILLSASVTMEARQRAQNAGADEFIGKPFDAAALVDTIDRITARWPVRQRDATAPSHARRPEGFSIRQPTGPAITRIQDDVVDRSRLAELEDIARDDTFLTELLRGFRTDVEVILRGLDNCVRDEDLERSKDLIHSLKGAAVGVGARQLSRLCDDFSAVDLRDPEQVTQIILDMKRCFDKTLGQLADYIRQQHNLTL